MELIVTEDSFIIIIYIKVRSNIFICNRSCSTATKTNSDNSSPFNQYKKLHPFVTDNEGNSTEHHNNDINDDMIIVGLETRLIDSSTYHHNKNKLDRNHLYNEDDDDCTLKSYVTPPSTSKTKNPNFVLYGGWNTSTTNVMPQSKLTESSSASILSFRSNNSKGSRSNSNSHRSVGDSSNNHRQPKQNNTSLVGEKRDRYQLETRKNDKENDVISITSNDNVSFNNWESILIQSYNRDDNNSRYDNDGIYNSSTHRSSHTTTGTSSCNSSSTNVSDDTSSDEVVFVRDNDLNQSHYHHIDIFTKINDGNKAVGEWRTHYMLRREKDILLQELPPKQIITNSIPVSGSELFTYNQHETRLISYLERFRRLEKKAENPETIRK